MTWQHSGPNMSRRFHHSLWISYIITREEKGTNQSHLTGCSWLLSYVIIFWQRWVWNSLEDWWLWLARPVKILLAMLVVYLYSNFQYRSLQLGLLWASHKTEAGLSFSSILVQCSSPYSINWVSLLSYWVAEGIISTQKVRELSIGGVSGDRTWLAQTGQVQPNPWGPSPPLYKTRHVVDACL